MTRTWFWTRRVAMDRTHHLEAYAAHHRGLTVAQEREPGLFARSFPAARGGHRGRVVEIRYGSDGWNTRRSASATHTLFVVDAIRGLPAGLRVFPSMTGGLVAKGGGRGDAANWLDHGRRRAVLSDWLQRVGYVSVSEARGLRVHVEGVALDVPTMTAWLDATVGLAADLDDGGRLPDRQRAG